MAAAGGSKIFNQPDMGSQVNVLLDRHGEDGVILGARYSKADQPPTTNGKLLKALLEGEVKRVNVCTRCLRSGKIQRAI